MRRYEVDFNEPVVESKPEITVVQRSAMPVALRAAFVFLLLVIIVQFAYIIMQTNSKQTVIWQGASSGQALPANYDTSENRETAASKISYNAPSNVYWVAELAEEALPFVVSIRTETYTKEEREQINGKGGVGPENPSDREGELFKQIPRQDGQSPSTPFDEFFRFFEQRGMDLDEQEFQKYHDFEMPPMQGQGSGFIVSEDGYIVTNAHVVANFDKFLVQTNDGTEYKGTLVGRDDLKDVAVIKIDAKGLAHAVLGNSDTIRPGEPAIAIGSPFGLKETVTSGIVSTVGRSPADVGMLDDPRSNRELIQTDAAIHPGNSGGPLLNARGEVIGINQAIIAGANRIGFAIPINSVKRSIESIIKNGDVQYPGLGIKVEELKKEFVEQYGLSISEGVLVREVTKDMPGAKAGLKAGDVITELNGKPVKTGSELIEQIQLHEVGDKITLTVYPKGNTPAKEILVVLGALNLREEAPWSR